MKKSAIYLVMVCASLSSAFAQVAPGKYFIEFSDKANSPYTPSRPGEFLSLRAVERRERQGIAIEQNDIPVDQTYIDRIRKFNAVILTRSKWLNGITISCPDSLIIDSILQLPFVKRIVMNKFIKNVYNSYSDNKFMSTEPSCEVNKNLAPTGAVDYNTNAEFNYGPSYNQIHMLKGDSLHKLGYRGKGMVIAVLDAGFYNVDTLPVFDSLMFNNQILGTKDFVSPGNNVYHEYRHGMEVLSCMGGNLPGFLIGTAPEADYWLLRSEDVNSEYIIEEYNWIAAAEFADSAGADIINSSLGYRMFDDPSQSHTCADMNGSTTPATIGANIATSKGMIVVNSAGNSGGSTWKCVSSPADGNLVLAVAAVDSNGIRAGFSSTGESTGRIKPNIAAMGRGAVVSSSVGTIIHNNGTSFSSPIIAGMVACLWQAAPDMNNHLISSAVEWSGHQASNPDSLLGYGIPDFIRALRQVHAGNMVRQQTLNICPNPFSDQLTVSFHTNRSQEFDLFLRDNLGRVVLSQYNRKAGVGDNEIFLPDLESFGNGCYILQISGQDLLLVAKVFKLRH